MILAYKKVYANNKYDFENDYGWITNFHKNLSS